MCTTLMLLCHGINVAMVNAETALICADIKKKKQKKQQYLSIICSTYKFTYSWLKWYATLCILTNITKTYYTYIVGPLPVRFSQMWYNYNRKPHDFFLYYCREALSFSDDKNTSFIQ